jgi:hypothetical protein
LNAYLDKCLKIIALFYDFTVQHVFRDKKSVVNDLTQQASGFWSDWGKLYVLEKSDVLVSQICFAEPNSTKSNGLISETGGSRIFRSSDDLGEMTTAKPDGWRIPLVCYLDNPSHITDRKVRRQALKYVILDITLYRRTIDELLLKCLGLYQSRIAMGEVYEGICGIHWSAH